MSIIDIDRRRCNRDRLCVMDCPAHIIRMGADGYPEIAPGAEMACLECGHCLAVCPCDALTLRGLNGAACPPDEADRMEFGKLAGLVRSRRSVRAFKKEPVDGRTLDKLFEAVRWAPSGGNQQPVQWLVIETPDALKEASALVVDWARGIPQLKEMAAAADAGHDIVLRGAPCLAVAYAKPGYGSTPADCVIAVTTLELLATSLGLGACWAGFFMMACGSGSEGLEKLLALPEGCRVFGALMLGYPRYGYSRVPPRKPSSVKRI